MNLILLALFYSLSPLLILHLCRKYRFVNKLGAVFIAYIIGLIVGNLGLLPEGSGMVQNTINTVTIPLAIPLLLFSANIREWGKLARVTFLALLLGIISVVVIVVVGFFIYSGHGIDELWKISGMLIGVYTGGTPNLASLKMMLDVDADTYILTHTYDMAISVLYLAFLMSFGKNLLRRILLPFPQANNADPEDYDGTDPYKGMLTKEKFLPLLIAVLVAVLIFAIGGGLSFLFDKNLQMVIVILTITTLGIGASFIPAINRIDKTFEAGMYLILIFSIVVASMADVSHFGGLAPGLIGYIALAVFGSMALHIILCRIFKVDADTLMITSASLVCSPPFVPVIAGAIGNRRVIVSGLTVGIIGYAIGNYLGYVVAEVLKAF